eukprot:1141047-Pelagomonas_calceolata.AAC.3
MAISPVLLLHGPQPAVAVTWKWSPIAQCPIQQLQIENMYTRKRHATKSNAWATATYAMALSALHWPGGVWHGHTCSCAYMRVHCMSVEYYIYMEYNAVGDLLSDYCTS